MKFKPFNILYLSSFETLQGGGQVSLFHLVNRLDRTAFKPHVVVPANGELVEKLKENHLSVFVLDLPKVIDFRLAKAFKGIYKLMTLIKKLKIDLIHTDGPRNTFYAGLISKFLRIPLIWHIRASNSDPFDRLLIRSCDKLVLVADALRKRFHGLIDDTKIVTIYNGIDLFEFIPHEKPSKIQTVQGIKKEYLIIGTVGRVEESKGQEILIEACGMLDRKFKEFCILIIGETTDLKYKQKCQKRAESLGIGDRIVFTGYQKNINNILADIDILVFPSIDFDAFPRSIIEAMGCSLPVITTDIGGCAEAIEDGISGFVIPCKDPKSIAEKLFILVNDNELRLKMGKASRLRAERMFSIEANVRKTQQVYRQVLSARVNPKY